MIIKNLIFDLDGTLIDSSDGVVEAVNYSLVQMGEPEQEPERIKRYIGYPLSQMYPDFTDIPVKELYKHFQVKAKDTVVSSTQVLDGVQETLDCLAGHGYKMAIATTKIKHHVDGIISKLGWQNLFVATAGGDEVSKVKPDPEIFRLAAKRMGAEHSETLVIGDTINDILAAKAIPLKVLAVKSPYGGDDKVKESKPDYMVDSIEQIFDILEIKR